MKSRQSSAAASRGFSMLEVLISVLLVSTVLLSLALLQVISLRGSSSSYMRTASVVLANDIAEKIRANRVFSANYVIAMGTAAPTTDANTAERDLLTWKTDLAAALPSGDGSIAVASGVVTITIDWQDAAGDATDYAGGNANANTRFVIRSTL